jgi:hypothetical protein
MIDGLLHVRSTVGTKVAHLGSLTPQSLARLLMWELSNEEECCGWDVLVGNLVRCIKEFFVNAYRRPQVAFLGATDPSTGQWKETSGKQVILTPAAAHWQ